MCTDTLARPLDDLPVDPASRLRAALQLPLANRRIADWLFSNKARPFHRGRRFLAPHAFDHSLLLHVTQRFGPHPPEPILVLLVPTELLDGVAVGYTLAVDDLRNPRLHPFDPARCAPPTPAGRFAFDRVRRHIVAVKHDVTPTETALYSVNWFRGRRRQRCFISVPNLQYSFDNPPTKVLGITTKNERKLASVRRPPCAPPRLPAHPDHLPRHRVGTWPDLDVRRLHPHVLYDICPRDFCREPPAAPRPAAPRPAPPNHQPPPPPPRPLFDMRTLSLSPPALPAPSPSGPLDPAALSEWLHDLDASLEGHFFSPKIYRARLNPATGQMHASEDAALTSCVCAGDPGQHDLLKKMAAQAYYAVVLPLATEA